MRDEYLKGVLSSEKKNLELVGDRRTRRVQPPAPADHRSRRRGRPSQDGATGSALAEQSRSLHRPRRLRGARRAHLRTACPAASRSGTGTPPRRTSTSSRVTGIRWSTTRTTRSTRSSGRKARCSRRRGGPGTSTSTSTPRTRRDTWRSRTPVCCGRMRLHNIERHAVQLTPGGRQEAARRGGHATERRTVRTARAAPASARYQPAGSLQTTTLVMIPVGKTSSGRREPVRDALLVRVAAAAGRRSTGSARCRTGTGRRRTRRSSAVPYAGSHGNG